MNKGPNIKLKMFLLKRGITQRQLAWETEIDEGLISKAVRYSMTTGEMRERIADFLDVDQSDIFDLRNF